MSIDKWFSKPIRLTREVAEAMLRDGPKDSELMEFGKVIISDKAVQAFRSNIGDVEKDLSDEQIMFAIDAAINEAGLRERIARLEMRAEYLQNELIAHGIPKSTHHVFNGEKFVRADQ